MTETIINERKLEVERDGRMREALVPMKKATMTKLKMLKMRLMGINQVQFSAIMPARTFVMITSTKKVKIPNWTRSPSSPLSNACPPNAN